MSLPNQPISFWNYIFLFLHERASVRKKKTKIFFVLKAKCIMLLLYMLKAPTMCVCVCVKMRVMKRKIFYIFAERRKYGKIKMCVTTLLSLLSYCCYTSGFSVIVGKRRSFVWKIFMIVYLNRRRSYEMRLTW